MSRTYFERHEFKYWLPDSIARDAVRLAMPYLDRDVAPGAGPAQVQSSLYLETDGLHCYTRHADNAPDRFKLRVRAYGTDPTAAPASFFEVKRKINRVIVKRRAAVPTPLVRPLLEGDLSSLPTFDAKAAQNLEGFLYRQVAYRMRPMLLVRCEREAFVALDPLEDARLTIDRDIAAQPALGPDLSCDPRAWVPLDGAHEHGEPGARVMLEMKFCGAAPLWMHEVIERLGMYRIAFSKYMAGMSRVIVGRGDADDEWLARPA